MSDLISRQAAMERLMAQNVIMDGSEYHNGFNAGVNRAQEVIRNLSPVQSDVPVINVGDMISRREAIKAICEDGTWLERQGCTEITMAERKQRDADIIGKLPPVQPKRGHWMIEPTEEPEYCKCSECGYVNLIVEVFALDGYHYCPNCGAKMERNEDGTDL